MKKILSILTLSFVLASCSQGNNPFGSNNWSQEDIQKLQAETEAEAITGILAIKLLDNLFDKKSNPPIEKLTNCFMEVIMNRYAGYDAYIASKNDPKEVDYIANESVLCGIKYSDSE